MTDRYVKPGEGRRVRVPHRGFAVVPDAGDFLPDDVWLRRRLADGDLVAAEPPEAATSSVGTTDAGEPAAPAGEPPPAARLDASTSSPAATGGETRRAK